MVIQTCDEKARQVRDRTPQMTGVPFAPRCARARVVRAIYVVPRAKRPHVSVHVGRRAGDGGGGSWGFKLAEPWGLFATVCLTL